MLGLAVMVLASGAAQAASPEPVIRLDLARGPLITSSRITGLGGAFAGVAVGIDGVWRNPATLANRPDYSTDWFDYDLTLDWLITSATQVDFDGDGLQVGSADREFRAVNVGLSLQFGRLALGVLVASYGYGATDTTASSLDVTFVDILLGAAWAAADGAWIAGGGALISVLTLAAPTLGDDPVDLTGGALDIGILHRPPAAQWRLGGRLRFGAELGFDDAGASSATAERPAIEAAIPWEVALGWSLMLPADPARRYNLPLRHAPKTVLDRRYLLLAAEVALSGPTDGQSVEAVVDGLTRSSGRNVSASVHLGAEGEVFDDRVRARFGAYFEPNRVAAGLAGRLHVTGGIEIRLFEAIFMWKATFGFDLAPGWENVSLGVGFWK